MAEKYLIGDTIRFTGVIVNLDGDSYDPAVVTVTVYKKSGECLLSQEAATKVSPGNYKYDWKIEGTEVNTLEQMSDLIVIWDWSGPHKKKLSFSVTPEV